MRTRSSFWAIGALLGASLLWVPSDAEAQAPGRISVEGRPGITLPTGDLSNLGGGSGFSLGADVMLSLNRTVTGYFGVSHDQFSCAASEPCEGELNSGGFQAGLKALFRRDGAALPWARAGLLGHSLDTGDGSSDLGLGVELGAGFDLDVTPHFALVPAVGFRTFSADIDRRSLTASWFTVSLGAHLHF